MPFDKENISCVYAADSNDMLSIHAKMYIDTTVPQHLRIGQVHKPCVEIPCGTPTIRMFENPNGTYFVNMAQIDEQLNELDGKEITKGEISQSLQIQKLK